MFPNDCCATAQECSCMDDDREDECDHEDYDSDILTGRASCSMCGYSWWQSPAEIEAEIERHRRYHEWEAEHQRPWNRFREWLYGLRLSWRRRKAAAVDDDIPF